MPFSFICLISSSIRESGRSILFTQTIVFKFLSESSNYKFISSKEKTKDGWLYNIELTVDNTLGTGATVSILPISEGYFGTISPNPIAAGLQTIKVPFTDVPAIDSIICFRVMIELKGKKCWQDVCVYLPDCRNIGINELNPTYFTVAPNPSKGEIRVNHNYSGSSLNVLMIRDMVALLKNLMPDRHLLNQERFAAAAAL